MPILLLFHLSGSARRLLLLLLLVFWLLPLDMVPGMHDGQCMVASGACDDARLELLLSQTGELVDCTPVDASIRDSLWLNQAGP
jgi:hypothetical protein